MKKLLPSEKDFSDFQAKLEKEGFRVITGTEFESQFERLDLKAPRPKKGREIGFIFFANELKVVVWTTFLSHEQQAREEDSGWVLIASGDKALYFAHPLRRTKNFLFNLFNYAWIAKWRVLNRPLCPDCHQYMEITKGRGLKSRYWKCPNPVHRKPINLPWDHLMPPRALNFLKKQRRGRARYRNARLKISATIGQAMLKRKKWKQRRRLESQTN